MNILIIDDEFVTANKIKHILKTVGKGYVAINGKQALRYVNKFIEKEMCFDLILIDINLPDVNGLELLNKIRMIENNKKVKTHSKKIIITAEGSKDNVKKALKSQCDGFFVKPISRDKMLSKINNLGLKVDKKTISNKKAETNKKVEKKGNIKSKPRKKKIDTQKNYQMKQKIRNQKKKIFKIAMSDHKMAALLNAVVDFEYWSVLDEKEN